MNRTLYTLLFYLLMPCVFLRLLWRSIQAPAYRSRWGQRLGFYAAAAKVRNPAESGGSIIFHAVSVGEVHAAVPLIHAAQKEFPQHRIVVTTSTPTGSARVKAIFGEAVIHVYLPYDLPGAVNRFLDFSHPELLVIMETELWPNLIHYCSQRGIKSLLANARLSNKSLRRYKKIRRLASQMLNNLNAVAAQSALDADAFVELGLRRSCISVTGSMKFDVASDSAQLMHGRALKESWGKRKVLLAASTREGEEEKVLAAFQQISQSVPEALLVLVPRHPERFDNVYRLAQTQGFNVVKRSSGEPLSASSQILLGDSMGEMSFYYGIADLTFVGGSLVDTGCQNIIEPAAIGLPVLTGPSLFNFKGVSEILLGAGAMRVVADEKGLSKAVIELFSNDELAQDMSSKALAAVEANKGATQGLLEICDELIRL